MRGWCRVVWADCCASQAFVLRNWFWSSLCAGLVVVTGDHSVISLHNVNRIRVGPTKMGTCNRVEGVNGLVGGRVGGWLGV